MITLTTMPGTSCRSTRAPKGTSPTDSTRRVVSTLASGIASTPTPGVNNGSGLPGRGPGLEPCRTVQAGLLSGIQGYPQGSGTRSNWTAVPFYGSYNFESNQLFEISSYRDMISM